MKNNLRSIIKQAIDIHVHIGPEIIPRKYTVETLVKEESDKIGGMVLKNHFYPTAPFINGVDTKKLQLFAGIVLNNFVGGLNPEAIYSASLLTNKPIMVWLPTVNARNFLEKSTFEIAPEWILDKTFKGRFAKNVKPVEITKNGDVTNECIEVLKMIKKVKAVLATGHISWEESLLVAQQAKTLGIKKIVITHPIYQRINMPVDIQKNLAKNGCFLEQCYSMHAIDRISMKKIAQQIKDIGYKSIILSSDVGQTFSESPSKAMFTFGNLLLNEGVKEKEFFTMMVENPKKLFHID